MTQLYNLEEIAADQGVISCPEPPIIPKVPPPSWMWSKDPATPGTACGNSALVSLPTVNGLARRFSVTGGAGGGERFHVNPGVLDKDSTHWAYDTYVNVVDFSHISELEFDFNQVIDGGDTVIFGMQFNYVKNLVQVTKKGTDGKSKWVDTLVPCAKFSEGFWHRVQFNYSRVGGTVTYESVGVDGVIVPIVGASYASSFPLGWTPIGTLVCNYQIDGDNTSNWANVSYLDRFNLTGY